MRLFLIVLYSHFSDRKKKVTTFSCEAGFLSLKKEEQVFFPIRGLINKRFFLRQ